MKLTLEVEFEKNKLGDEDISEVAICFNEEGLNHLIRKLESLRRNVVDHEHLMTESWAGQDLTEEKYGGDAYVLANHLRLVRIVD